MLMNKINNILNTTYTNDTYHAICKYIKDNILEIPNMSIDEIAEGCFVSKSMISKFTKKLGYETFKDFKYDCEIHCDLIKHMPSTEYKTGNIRENVIETMDLITNAFRNAANKIDYKALDSLIEDIDKCSCVVAVGHGASKNVCESLQFYLDYINKPVMVADIDFTREVLIEENSIILIISAMEMYLSMIKD
ncbi:MurR/RpiR family transcriptional regulator [Clostridium saudiense]|nr:MurR/RpiR family transcriptional regulator [Clostridium saudiense]